MVSDGAFLRNFEADEQPLMSRYPFITTGVSDLFVANDVHEDGGFPSKCIQDLNSSDETESRSCNICYKTTR